MVLPILIAAPCCLGLLLLGVLLGAAIRQSPIRRRIATYQSTGSSAAAMAHVPVAMFLHPRLDLAAGHAPRRQAVNLEQQRSRHELSESAVQPPVTAPPSPTAFEPFEQRQKHSRSFRHRLDLVYARDTMGDLSDPVCRRHLAA